MTGNFLEVQAPFVMSNTTFVTIFAGANDVDTIMAAIGGGAGGSDQTAQTAYINSQIDAFGQEFATLIRNGSRSRACRAYRRAQPPEHGWDAETRWSIRSTSPCRADAVGRHQHESHQPSSIGRRARDRSDVRSAVVPGGDLFVRWFSPERHRLRMDRRGGGRSSDDVVSRSGNKLPADDVGAIVRTLAPIAPIARRLSSFFHLSRGGKICPRRGIGKPSRGFCRSLLYMKHILSSALIAVVVAVPASAQSRLKLPPNLFAAGQAVAGQAPAPFHCRCGRPIRADRACRSRSRTRSSAHSRTTSISRSSASASRSSTSTWRASDRSTARWCRRSSAIKARRTRRPAPFPAGRPARPSTTRRSCSTAASRRTCRGAAAISLRRSTIDARKRQT